VGAYGPVHSPGTAAPPPQAMRRRDGLESGSRCKARTRRTRQGPSE
jgi:hypothetical protein